jgi:hypothetical protein
MYADLCYEVRAQLQFLYQFHAHGAARALERNLFQQGTPDQPEIAVDVPEVNSEMNRANLL